MPFPSAPDRLHSIELEFLAHFFGSNGDDKSDQFCNGTKNKSCVEGDGVNQNDDFNLSTQTIELASDLPGEEPAIAGTPKAKRAGRLRGQYVRYVGPCHFFNRQFGIGIRMWVKQIDGPIARQHAGQFKRVESASRKIAMAEQEWPSVAFFDA